MDYEEYSYNDGDTDYDKEDSKSLSGFNLKTISRYIRNFVENGGRLVTTDWSLSLVSAAFPGKLHKTNETSDDVVEIKASDDLGRKLIGLTYTQCHPKWWLEGSSHIYKTSKNVIDILVSEEMKRKYGQKNIASAFSYGKGEVFHFISHFELQRSHQKIKHDYGTLSDFLKKIDAKKTGRMQDANMAELEAAYSTLNTLAHLCMPYNLLSTKSNSE